MNQIQHTQSLEYSYLSNEAQSPKVYRRRQSRRCDCLRNLISTTKRAQTEESDYAFSSTYHRANAERPQASKAYIQKYRKQDKVILHRGFSQSKAKKVKYICADLFERFPPIFPNNSILIAWQLFIAFCCITIFFEVPLDYFFDLNLGVVLTNSVALNVAKVIFSIVLFLDMLLQFNIGVFSHGKIVTNKVKIAEHYLTDAFVFDLIGNITYMCLTCSITIYEIRWVHLLLFCKIKSFIVLDRKLIQFFNHNLIFKSSYTIFKIVIRMFFIIHYFACIFYGVGREASQNGENSWLNQSTNFGTIQEGTLKFQYCIALYWAFSTLFTSGYGDISPYNLSEITVSIVAMMVAMLFFAYNVGIIYDVIHDLNSDGKKMQRSLELIQGYLKDKHVSQELETRVLQYLSYKYKTESTFNQEERQEVIKQLNPKLQEDLQMESYDGIVQRIPWMQRSFDGQFLKEVALDIEEVEYPTQAEMHDSEAALYMLERGEVELYLDAGNEFFGQKGEVPLAILKEGTEFGQHSFITGEQRTAMVRFPKDSKLYRLTRSRFLDRLRDNPVELQRYYQLHDQVVFNQRLDMIGLKCYACDSGDHMVSRCPLTQYFPEMRHIIRKIQLSRISYQQHRNPIKHERQPNKRKRLILDNPHQYNQDGDSSPLEHSRIWRATQMVTESENHFHGSNTIEDFYP